MAMQHNRRIFKGYYKRYDGEYVYVIRTMKEMDTGVDYVVGMYHNYAYESEMFLITKQSFCEMVEINGEWVDKFVRQTQMRRSDIMDAKVDKAEFPIRTASIPLHALLTIIWKLMMSRKVLTTEYTINIVHSKIHRLMMIMQRTFVKILIMTFVGINFAQHKRSSLVL